MYKFFMSSSNQQGYYIVYFMSFFPLRVLLVVQVWMGRRENQVHEVCLDRMVVQGCQALLDFLLRSESIAFITKGVCKFALCTPLSLALFD